MESPRPVRHVLQMADHRPRCLLHLPLEFIQPRPHLALVDPQLQQNLFYSGHLALSAFQHFSFSAFALASSAFNCASRSATCLAEDAFVTVPPSASVISRMH